MQREQELEAPYRVEVRLEGVELLFQLGDLIEHPGAAVPSPVQVRGGPFAHCRCGALDIAPAEQDLDQVKQRVGRSRVVLYDPFESDEV